MQNLIEPIKTESLKEVFISKFEKLILSGQLEIGQKLPSERELALQLGVSRPVVHEGLIDLSFKGLVSMTPRVGTIVNDYRKEGSLALLSSLFSYNEGRVEAKLLDSLLDMRKLFEVESAKLAATNRTEDDIESLKRIIKEEENTDQSKSQNVAELDFSFHHQIALSSGNMIYPLFLNTFKQIYLNLSGQFFGNQQAISAVLQHQKKLVEAIESGNPEFAENIMSELLEHGAKLLKDLYIKKNGGGQ